VRRASAARAVEATQMNAQSSRSHTLFLLYITVGRCRLTLSTRS
jgi:kinesin family protein C1